MAVADATQRELSYRKRLVEIANLINSAPGIPEILVELKDPMLDLVEAVRVTIYALDTKNQELFSLFKAGQEVREIRVPKTFASIAGFTALSRKTANIEDAYDAEELGRFHANLRFDARWDKSSGFRTKQVLADAHRVRQVPPGCSPAHQQAGRHPVQRQGRGGGRGAREDPGDRLLQPAPRRPLQQALQVRRAGGQGAGLREGPREGHRQREGEPDRRGQGPRRGSPDPEGGDPGGTVPRSTTAPPGRPPTS